MKILLVCAGGMSTGLLVKKMTKYWKENNADLDIKACGVSSYENHYKDYDIIMIGPQVSYKLEEIKKETKMPTAIIPSYDYAIGDCEKIMQLANKLYSTRNNQE